MEPDHSHSSSTPSSLRWQILRRALRRRPSSNPEHSSEEKIILDNVSRRTRNGFNLIPWHLVNEGGEDSVSLPKRDACFCYSLPFPNAPKLYLRQRWEDCVDLNDFKVCNRYDIDNTGLVCQWPSEDVLAYYSMLHLGRFRSKRVIELGSGYGLAGFVIAMVAEASEVAMSRFSSCMRLNTGRHTQHNIDANFASFGGTKVKSMILHWDQFEVSDITGTFDVIVASDCTFFKEFHEGLARTIRCLLKENGPSEAILFSPKRGDSLEKFLVKVKDSGLHFTITETYDTEISRRHKNYSHVPIQPFSSI
ncbi:calmodulin-lysine n-methyltransferase [Phtheirospermum japonicum]|uniref:Calmodulin-lysine N-methyltransferase n=1 Tax=Phtheirospermum japonicum TaxID=374723 RepID=A0A830CA96_9LAMI|nr:calmodulin-lysine n-methyltransferase [Phtheirospermum japonicum]